MHRQSNKDRQLTITGQNAQKGTKPNTQNKTQPGPESETQELQERQKQDSEREALDEGLLQCRSTPMVAFKAI